MARWSALLCLLVVLVCQLQRAASQTAAAPPATIPQLPPLTVLPRDSGFVAHELIRSCGATPASPSRESLAADWHFKRRGKSHHIFLSFSDLHALDSWLRRREGRQLRCGCCPAFMISMLHSTYGAMAIAFLFQSSFCPTPLPAASSAGHHSEHRWASQHLLLRLGGGSRRARLCKP